MYRFVLPAFVFTVLLAFATVELAGANSGQANAGQADAGKARPGSILRLSGQVLASAADAPQCFVAQHFCLAAVDGGYVALYTYETNPYFRHQGCQVRWEPERSYVDPATQVTETGAFRDGCSGSTYSITGRRVFGPAPHDLDEFPLRVVTDPATQRQHVEVDTRRLFCRTISSGDPCIRGPQDQIS